MLKSCIRVGCACPVADRGTEQLVSQLPITVGLKQALPVALDVTLSGFGHNLLAHTNTINAQPRRQQLTF